jgi:mannose-6-phosphate isomerase-like protein (cupin superfamily)
MQRTVELRAGQGFVVPRGVWHRLIVRQPSAFVVMTPGPSKVHRPPPS